MEFKEVMRKFGQDLGDEERRHVIKIFDDDNNDLVCFDEFQNLMGGKNFCSEDMDLQLAFNTIDVDGSGSIAMSEIQSLLQKTNQHLSEKEIGELLYGIDANGDRELDFFEFKELMTVQI